MALRPALRGFCRPQQRGQIARGRRHQDRDGGGCGRQRQRVFGQAQQIAGAGIGAAAQLVRIARIHAHRHALGAQRLDGRFKMRERGIGQAPEIDDIGSGGAQYAGAGHDGLDRAGRGVDDLGKQPHVVT